MINIKALMPGSDGRYKIGQLASFACLLTGIIERFNVFYANNLGIFIPNKISLFIVILLSGVVAAYFTAKRLAISKEDTFITQSPLADNMISFLAIAIILFLCVIPWCAKFITISLPNSTTIQQLILTEHLTFFNSPFRFGYRGHCFDAPQFNNALGTITRYCVSEEEASIKPESWVKQFTVITSPFGTLYRQQ